MKKLFFFILLFIASLQYSCAQPGGGGNTLYEGYIDCISSPAKFEPTIVILEYLIEAKDEEQLQRILDEFKDDYFENSDIVGAMSAALENTDKDPQGIFITKPVEVITIDELIKENGELMNVDEYARFMEAKVSIIKYNKKNQIKSKYKF